MIRLSSRGNLGRCVYCYESLRSPTEVQRCRACGVLLHRECRLELQACPTLGCAGPSPRRDPGASPPRRGREGRGARELAKAAGYALASLLLVLGFWNLIRSDPEGPRPSEHLEVPAQPASQRPAKPALPGLTRVQLLRQLERINRGGRLPRQLLAQGLPLVPVLADVVEEYSHFHLGTGAAQVVLALGPAALARLRAPSANFTARQRRGAKRILKHLDSARRAEARERERRARARTIAADPYAPLGMDEDLDFALTLLRHPNPEHAKAAERALLRRERPLDPDLQHALVGALELREPENRRRAIRVAASVFRPSAELLQALGRCAEDPATSADLQRAARGALRKLEARTPWPGR